MHMEKLPAWICRREEQTHPMVLEAQLQDRVEALHVLSERLPTYIGEGTDRQHGFLMHAGGVALKDT